MTLHERQGHMLALSRIVSRTGEAVLQYQPTSAQEMGDFVHHGHEGSGIDTVARERMQAAIDREYPEFKGKLRFELWPYGRRPLEASNAKGMVIIADEVDGTTNTKRWLAARLRSRPLACISAALSSSDRLDDAFAAAVYTLDNGDTFSSFRGDDGEFLSFCNSLLLDPCDYESRRGDSRDRIHVIGYSNSHRREKGALEQVLWDAGFKIYEGCRASSMDVVNILRNQSDAYVDCRALWPTTSASGKEEAMLQAYDIAGVLPTALGCGLLVSDARGESWGTYGLLDALSLVVARPDIHGQIVSAIQPLIKEWAT